MKTLQRSLSAILTITMAGSFAVATVGIASASEGTSSSASVTSTLASNDKAALTENEVDRLAHDLEILFTRYVQLDEQERFVVNDANLISDGYEDAISDLQYLADALNSVPQSAAPSNDKFEGPVIKPAGAGDFALCVLLEGLGIPSAAASPGLVAAIKEGIRAWNWGLTAKTVARILGPTVVKALGGPVGIGVALGWAARSCRGKL